MKVRLNLATKALETHRRFLAGAGLTAAFAGIVFVGLGWHVYSARKVDEERRARAESNRREMSHLEAQRSELDAYFHQKDIATLHDRAAFINTILDARSFNWTLMFMDLERILPGVGAINDEAELKFEHAIEESREFTGVQIQNVHQTNDQKVIQLTAVYSRM